MKTLLLTLFLTLGVIGTASAHHNSNSDSAGGNINDNSGHLELVF